MFDWSHIWSQLLRPVPTVFSSAISPRPFTLVQRGNISKFCVKDHFLWREQFCDQNEQFSDEIVKSGCEQSKRMIWTLILKTQEFFNGLFLRDLLAKQGGRETYTQKMPWTTYWLIGVFMETEQSVSSASAYWDGGQWKTLEVGCPPNPTLEMIFFHCLDGQDSSCWCQGAYWDFH